MGGQTLSNPGECARPSAGMKKIMSALQRPVLAPADRLLLRMVGAGLSGFEVAEQLGEPLTTTAARLRRIRERLQVSSTAQAVTTAEGWGLLEEQ